MTTAEHVFTETVDGLIRSLVGSLIRGIADDLTTNVDAITDRVIESITGVGAIATPPEPELEPEPVAPAPPPARPVDPVTRTAKARAAQDTTEHVCEYCQRRGTRRFIRTPSGWRCAPTARCGDRPAITKAPGARTSPAAVEPPTPTITAEVTPILEPDIALCGCGIPGSHVCKDAYGVVQPTESSALPGYTARCQDCTRTWTLTGRVLEMAVEQHELKHAHIVNIVGGDQ